MQRDYGEALREIVCEFAKTDPAQEVETSCEEFELRCPYCDGFNGKPPQHQAECLWLRARGEV